MTIDHDKYCKRCEHYEYEASRGIVCGLTHDKPAFDGHCDSFELDSEREKIARSSKVKSLFLHVPVARLVLLSIVSCGLYEAYWIYKNWEFTKERQSVQSIKPFWRGVFGVFFCHRLLKEIHADEEASALLQPSFSAGGLATGWVTLVILANLLVRLSEIEASIIGFVMPSYLFLVPVQNYINSVTEKQSHSPSFYGWSSGHIVCLLIGIIVWALTLSALSA